MRPSASTLDSPRRTQAGALPTKGRDYDKEIADETMAIQLDPKHAMAYYNRAVAYSHQRDYQKAIADNTESIRLNPTYANAYYNRGIAYQQMANANAKADFLQAEKLGHKAKSRRQMPGGPPMILGAVILIVVAVIGMLAYTVHRTLSGSPDRAERDEAFAGRTDESR